MDLFNKKKLKDLEAENKKLQEEKDRLTMIYNISIKNKEKLEHEYRSLKAGSDGLKSVMEMKNKKIKELDLTNKNMRFKLEKIESLYKSIDKEFIKSFRKVRGRAIKSSNKRIRNKYINKMTSNMERILEEVGE